jgi:hypothetical protein
MATVHCGIAKAIIYTALTVKPNKSVSVTGGFVGILYSTLCYKIFVW